MPSRCAGAAPVLVRRPSACAPPQCCVGVVSVVRGHRPSNSESASDSESLGRLGRRRPSESSDSESAAPRRADEADSDGTARGGGGGGDV
jgi:hypothetical protein